MPEAPEFNLSGQKSIVPPMKNVVGDTYAETRAEIEARKRAEAAAELAKIQAATPVEKTPAKKSSVWFAVLTILFLLIALAGAGFAVFEYTENETLKENYDTLEKEYESLRTERDDAIENYNTLKKAYDRLRRNSTTEPVTEQTEE